MQHAVLHVLKFKSDIHALNVTTLYYYILYNVAMAVIYCMHLTICTYYVRCICLFNQGYNVGLSLSKNKVSWGKWLGFKNKVCDCLYSHKDPDGAKWFSVGLFYLLNDMLNTYQTFIIMLSNLSRESLCGRLRLNSMVHPPFSSMWRVVCQPAQSMKEK